MKNHKELTQQQIELAVLVHAILRTYKWTETSSHSNTQHCISSDETTTNPLKNTFRCGWMFAHEPVDHLHVVWFSKCGSNRCWLSSVKRSICAHLFAELAGTLATHQPNTFLDNKSNSKFKFSQNTETTCLLYIYQNNSVSTSRNKPI